MLMAIVKAMTASCRTEGGTCPPAPRLARNPKSVPPLVEGEVLPDSRALSAVRKDLSVKLDAFGVPTLENAGHMFKRAASSERTLNCAVAHVPSDAHRRDFSNAEIIASHGLNVLFALLLCGGDGTVTKQHPHTEAGGDDHKSGQVPIEFHGIPQPQTATPKMTCASPSRSNSHRLADETALGDDPRIKRQASKKCLVTYPHRFHPYPEPPRLCGGDKGSIEPSCEDLARRIDTSSESAPCLTRPGAHRRHGSGFPSDLNDVALRQARPRAPTNSPRARFMVMENYNQLMSSQLPKFGQTTALIKSA